MEAGLAGLRLLPVPVPLPLPALLLLAVLGLHLVEGGQLLPLQGQRALLLLLQEPVPLVVAAGQGGPLQLHVAVPLRDHSLRTDRTSETCRQPSSRCGGGTGGAVTCRL